MSDVIRLANAYPDTVKAIIVGNEVLLRGEQTPEALAAMLARVKQATGKPVTYADVWEFWLKAPQLANAVDFVTIHILPYWEDQPQPVEAGLAHLEAIVDKVRAAFPAKPILIGETGWPSEGRERENAVPSLVNQARYLREFMALNALDPKLRVACGPKFGTSVTIAASKTDRRRFGLKVWSRDCL